MIDTRKRPNGINRDVVGGLVMIGAGLAFAYFSQEYRIGSMRQMGPGFVPFALGLVLAALGVAIALGGLAAARRQALQHEPLQMPDWRGLSAIVLGVVSFILLGERGGLAVSAFAVVFIAALGDRNNRLRDALLLAVGMTVVGVVVFYYGLQIRLPLLPDALS